MSDLTALYLDSVRRAVTETLLPELQTAMARHRVDLINMILSRLVVMESGLPGFQRDFWAGFAPALAGLAQQLPPNHPALPRVAILLEQTRQPPAEDVLIAAWDEGLAAAVQDVLHLLESDPVEQRDALITSLATDEDRFRERYEGQVAAVMAARSTDRAESDRPINDETLSAYLQERFPEQVGIHAANVRHIPGGRSKSTIMFDMTVANQQIRQVVMRKDFPVNFLKTAVLDEFPMLQILSSLKAPVAKPLWMEPDPRQFGTPFMVSEKVAGKTAGTLFDVAEASQAAGLELARVLAFFHRLDLDATGIAQHVQFGDSTSAANDLVEHWYGRWKEGATTPSAILEAAFTWLRDRKSVVSTTKHLVHGDAGIHNLMIDGDHVTALVDWEFAHAGDAAEDLAYCSTYVRQFMDWERFLTCYVDAGGPAVTAAQLDYWGVWAAVRNAVATNLAQKSYVSGEDRDLRVAAMGMNTYPKLLRNLARALKGGH